MGIWKVENMTILKNGYKTTYIAAVVHRVGDNPIINEGSTTVRLFDEAGGPFFQIEDCEGTTIQIDHDEFDIVAEVARKMLLDFDDGSSEDQRAITESQDEDEDDKETIRQATPLAAICDLLAVIHRDGGQHTGEVGMVQSCKDAEAVVRGLRSDDARNKSNEWTTANPTNGGVYWVQLDRGLAPATVEIYKLDEDDVWRARVVGKADILGSHIASFQVESLTKALWNGPISAPPLP